MVWKAATLSRFLQLGGFGILMSTIECSVSFPGVDRCAFMDCLVYQAGYRGSVRAEARYCSAPKLLYWKAARSILGYAMRTSSFGISSRKGTLTGISLVSFADADYASRSADRRSVSGRVVMCAGGPVSWHSKTQNCVTLSTTQAEYVAMSDMRKEILFLRQGWCFMQPEAKMPCITMHEDNDGAIQIAKHTNLNLNLKHIDARHHFLREQVERKEVEIIHVASQYQQAKFLTKALPEREFEFHWGIVMNLMWFLSRIVFDFVTFYFLYVSLFCFLMYVYEGSKTWIQSDRWRILNSV